MSGPKDQDIDKQEDEWLEEENPAMFDLLNAVEGDEESLQSLEREQAFKLIALTLLGADPQDFIHREGRPDLTDLFETVTHPDLSDWLGTRCPDLHLLFQSIRGGGRAMRKLKLLQPNVADLAMMLRAHFNDRQAQPASEPNLSVPLGPPIDLAFVTALRGGIGSTEMVAVEADAVASLAWGLCYQQGIGLAKNPKKAVTWFRKAAKLRETDAQEYLGVAYFWGEGVETDYNKAKKWFQLPAERGYLSSQLYLAIIHLEGLGVPKDEAVGLAWADKPPCRITLNVGWMYHRIGMNFWRLDHSLGLGAKYHEIAQPDFQHVFHSYMKSLFEIRRPLSKRFFLAAVQWGYVPACRHMANFEKAPSQRLMWLRRAATGGDAEAQYELARQYEHEDLLGEAEDIKWLVEKDDSEAAKWLLAAAGNGHCEAQYKIGVWYLHGTGVQENYCEAARWFRAAAEAEVLPTENNPWNIHHNYARCNSICLLGELYYHGQGVRRDAAKAAELFRTAAEAESPRGANWLGLCYLNGFGVRSVPEEAARWFAYAANNNNVSGRCNLANCYKDGIGVPQDQNKAFELMSKSVAWPAGEDYDEGQYELGCYYEQGIGVQADDAEALKWFYKAAKNGFADAIKKVVAYARQFDEPEA